MPTGMDLEDSMLCKKVQGGYYVSSLRCGIWKTKQMKKHAKQKKRGYREQAGSCQRESYRVMSETSNGNY